MELLYNGVDIFEQIRIKKVILEQYLSGHVDTIKATFDNSDEKWTKWSPKPGDTIEINEKYAQSGLMYIQSIVPENDDITLIAAPIRRIQDGKDRNWINISFFQLIKYMAAEIGLTPEFYGATDQRYGQVAQMGESNLTFLKNLCEIEGCGLMVNNGILRVISYDYLKKMETSPYLFEAINKRIYDQDYYSGCEVSDGIITGKSGDSSGEVLYFRTDMPINSIGTANRFANNMLHVANLKRKGGSAMVDKLFTELMTGSKVQISCGYWTEKDVLITRVRYDLFNEKTKIWFSVLED